MISIGDLMRELLDYLEDPEAGNQEETHDGWMAA